MVDSMSKALSSRVQGLLGAELHHCEFCRFQFYDLHRLWQDIGTASAAGLDLVHLVTEPVRTGDIVARFFPGAAIGEPPAGGSAAYDFRTRHAAIFAGRGGYIYDASEAMRRSGAYVASARAAPK